MSAPPSELTEEEKQEAEESYALEQRQRCNERQIRKYKRLTEGTLDPDEKAKYAARLKQWEQVNADLIEQHGDVLRYRAEREKVRGLDITVPKPLTEGENGDIIKAKGVKSLEQAKKRDHKIYITDIAIDRVGQVELSDFSDIQVKNMQKKHKELMRVSKDENDSNEVLFIEGLDFKSEVSVLRDEFTVSPGNNPFAVSVIRGAEKQSLIYMHNHPSTNIFSMGDIDTLVCEGAKKTMSVVTNQGEVYVLNKTTDYSYANTKIF